MAGRGRDAIIKGSINQEQMKTAPLTPYITYVSLTDDDGDFGILLNHYNGNVVNAVEVYDKDHFSRVYDEMVALSTPAEVA